MKKISVIALVLVLTVSLAACRRNNPADTSASTTRATTAPTTQATTAPTTRPATEATTQPTTGILPDMSDATGDNGILDDATDGIMDGTMGGENGATAGENGTVGNDNGNARSRGRMGF